MIQVLSLPPDRSQHSGTAPSSLENPVQPPEQLWILENSTVMRDKAPASSPQPHETHPGEREKGMMELGMKSGKGAQPFPSLSSPGFDSFLTDKLPMRSISTGRQKGQINGGLSPLLGGLGGLGPCHVCPHPAGAAGVEEDVLALPLLVQQPRLDPGQDSDPDFGHPIGSVWPALLLMDTSLGVFHKFGHELHQLLLSDAVTAEFLLQLLAAASQG